MPARRCPTPPGPAASGWWTSCPPWAASGSGPGRRSSPTGPGVLSPGNPGRTDPGGPPMGTTLLERVDGVTGLVRDRADVVAAGRRITHDVLAAIRGTGLEPLA